MRLEERLARFLGKGPQVDPSAYVAHGSTIVGDVVIGPQASLWPGSVLRADINFIRVGRATNIQDGVIVHLADDYPAIIGDYVTVGHGAVVHACTIEDEVLVGMNCTILDGAVIGKGSIIGAHTLIKPGMCVPPGCLVLGVPGRVVRDITEDEIQKNRASAEKYIAVAAAHRKKLTAIDGPCDQKFLHDP